MIGFAIAHSPCAGCSTSGRMKEGAQVSATAGSKGTEMNQEHFAILRRLNFLAELAIGLSALGMGALVYFMGSHPAASSGWIGTFFKEYRVGASLAVMLLTSAWLNHRYEKLCEVDWNEG